MGWAWHPLHPSRFWSLSGGYNGDHWEWKESALLVSFLDWWRNTKDIAPLIFDKRKKCTVQKAMEENFRVNQISTDGGLSLEHIVQFNKLWSLLQAVILEPNTSDSISEKLTSNGWYSSELAYNLQFMGLTKSPMLSLVWKPWAPPKCRIFS
jgi:hypothetical protein